MLIIEANLIKYLPTTENFDYEAIRGEYDYDISNLYLGEDPTEYAYGIPFYDNLGPVINASVYTYTTKVENPITTTQLIEEIDLVAYDEYDGNLTSEIVVNDVNYRNQVLDKITSQRVLGTYPIIFSVTDSSGNSSSFTIEVIVIDDISPTLDVAASTLSYTREVYIGSLTLQSIQDNVVVTDNHTDNLNITITENQYSGNETKLGTYQIVFEYRDLANNILTVTVTVTIQDTTAPLLVASKTNQSLRYTENLSLLEVFTLMGVNLSDNYDTNITYIILSDNYTGHEVTVGNYTVNLQATDSSGNQSNLTLQIAIFDDIDPIFYIRDNKITVKTTQLLTYDQIDALMQERHLVKNEAYNFEVISDTYTDNATLAGDYTVKVKVTYQNGEVEYQSLNITVKEEVKPTFLMQVWNVIKAIFAFLWKIIKWPFEQLINLF